MRLSDAIALGRTLVTPRLGHEWFDDGAGCARGMALEGCGMGRIASRAISSNWSRFFMTWSWTKEHIPAYPCGCLPPGYANGFNTISHLFDDHVSCGDWTLDQLIDWVRSVEPPETETTSDATSQADTKAILSAK